MAGGNQKMHSQKTKLLAPLLMSLALAACSGSNGPLPYEIIDLKGTDWILTQLNGKSLQPNTNITLEFSDSVAGGFAGCNAYGGKYTVTSDGALKFDEVAITEMLCSSPNGVMAQEQAFSQAIVDARSFRVIDDHLEIANAGGETILTFKRREVFPMDPRALVGTQWRLLSWNGKSPLPDSEITIAFSGSQISGSAGCRSYTGTYTASGDKIRFPSLSMTEITVNCSPVLAEQEGEYTTVLSWARHYLLTDGQLKLFSARGEVLVFVQ
jgi:heat shock protein HslJ